MKYRAFDNGGKTADRYTVLPTREHWRHYRDRHGRWLCLAASAQPFHPQGFGQSSECIPGPHLGKCIPFDSLPADVQRAARNMFEDL